MDLISQIVERAKANKQRIVLPEGTEERTLKAANQILTDGVADLILLGNPEEIMKLAQEWGLGNINKATIIDPENHEKKEAYAELLFELRKKKHLFPHFACDEYIQSRRRDRKHDYSRRPPENHSGVFLYLEYFFGHPDKHLPMKTEMNAYKDKRPNSRNKMQRSSHPRRIQIEKSKDVPRNAQGTDNAAEHVHPKQKICLCLHKAYRRIFSFKEIFVPSVIEYVVR